MDTTRDQTQPRRTSPTASRRWAHPADVLALLLDIGPSTVRDLAEEVGLSVVTVNRILRELVEQNLVDQLVARDGRRGPRARVFAVLPERVPIAAIVHQPGMITVTRADLWEDGPRVVVDRADPRDAAGVAEQIEDALRQAAIDPDSLSYVVAGTLAGECAELERALGSRLGCPTSVRSITELAAIGEARRGAARGVDDFFLVTEDSGATVVGGIPQPGAHGRAGSLGRLKELLHDNAEPDLSGLVRMLAAVCLVTDPALVVLSGPGHAEAAEQITKSLAGQVPAVPEVVPGRLGGDAALLGAVELARDLARAGLLNRIGGADR